MNWKPTWVLLAAAAVLFIFIVLVEHPIRRQRENQASRRLLPGFQPAAVTNIEIQPWGRPAIEALRPSSGNRSWRLTRPISYPAQDQKIAEFLDALSKLEWQNRMPEQELKDRPNAQEEFGFTKPPFTLLLQGPFPDQRLEIGDLTPWHDQVAVQVVGGTAIYLAGTDLLKLIPMDKNQWRDPALLQLSNVSFTAAQVRSPGKEFYLERDPTNHLWFMKKPLLARADTPGIDNLLSRLQAACVSGFVSDDPQADLESFGLQVSPQTPELSLSFIDGANTVALQMGRSPTNYPALAFVRREAPGNIVVVDREVLRPWQAPYTNFLDHHFLSLPPSLIDSISVLGDDDFVVQKQTNGQWLVLPDKTDKSFPADAALMADWLAGFTNVPTEIVKTVVTDFSDYGLVHPTLQYTVRFAPQARVPPARIDFGLNTNGNVFQRRQGEDFLNSVGRDEFDRLPRISWQLRDRGVWSFEAGNVLSVTIHQRGGVLAYTKDPDGNWTYAPGFNNQVNINSAAIEECLHRLGRLRAIYWDGIGNDHLERFGFAEAGHDVELELKRGDKTVTLRIQFGGRSPYSHPFASVVENGERLIFEFPADLYDNFVAPNLTVLTARRLTQ